MRRGHIWDYSQVLMNNINTVYLMEFAFPHTVITSNVIYLNNIVCVCAYISNCCTCCLPELMLMLREENDEQACYMLL